MNILWCCAMHSLTRCSGNIGIGGVAMFEAVHGTAPDIAGQDKVIFVECDDVKLMWHVGEPNCADTERRDDAAPPAAGHVC